MIISERRIVVAVKTVMMNYVPRDTQHTDHTETIVMETIAGVWLGFGPSTVAVKTVMMRGMVHEKEKPLRTMYELRAKGYPRARACRDRCLRAIG